MRSEEFEAAYNEAKDDGMVQASDVDIDYGGVCVGHNHEWIHACACRDEVKILNDPLDAGVHRFIVKYPPGFRQVIKKYPGVKLARISKNGDIAYECVDDDFYNECIGLELIEDILKDDIMLIETPLHLIDHIEKIERVQGDGGEFKIHVRNAVIKIGNEDIYEIGVWKSGLINANIIFNFNLRSNNSQADFHNFLKWILDHAKTVWNQRETTDDMIANTLITELNKLIVSKDRKGFLHNPMAVLVDEEMCKTIKSSTVMDVVHRKQPQMTIEKARQILLPYLEKPSKQIKIEGVRVSVWFFKHTQ